MLPLALVPAQVARYQTGQRVTWFLLALHTTSTGWIAPASDGTHLSAEGSSRAAFLFVVLPRCKQVAPYRRDDGSACAEGTARTPFRFQTSAERMHGVTTVRALLGVRSKRLGDSDRATPARSHDVSATCCCVCTDSIHRIDHVKRNEGQVKSLVVRQNRRWFDDPPKREYRRDSTVTSSGRWISTACGFESSTHVRIATLMG